LKYCKAYKALIIAQLTSASTSNPIRLEKRQAILVIPKITKETKEIRDLKAAMAVYIGRRPFNTYKNKYIKRFIINTPQNTYTPLLEQLISSQLLTEYHAYIKS
jgi:hypothetical protein